MPAYANKHGNSGVAYYEVIRVAAGKRQVDWTGGHVGPGDAELAIEVTFWSGKRYVYSESSAGSPTVQKMIQMAYAGRGLSTFIARQKPPFV